MWVSKLQGLVASIDGERNKAKAADHWKIAGTTLARTGIDKMRAARVVAMRDLPGLKGLVAELEANPQLAVQTRYVPSRPSVAASASVTASGESAGGAPVAVASPPVAAEPVAPPSEADLAAGLKAFRKRLKVTQLDEESRLSNRIVTSKRASVVAIAPPHQFPRAVWEALAEQGKLRRAGSGLYELVER